VPGAGQQLGEAIRGGDGCPREADYGVALVRWKLGTAAPPQWKLWAMTEGEDDGSTLENFGSLTA
jgi:hypothetical protein